MRILGFTYSPGDSNDSRYDKIKEYTLGSIEVYTHGLEIWIDSDIFALTNEQIVLIDTISHQEYITVKKKMSDYVAFGALLGNGIAGSLNRCRYRCIIWYWKKKSKCERNIYKNCLLGRA